MDRDRFCFTVLFLESSSSSLKVSESYSTVALKDELNKLYPKLSAIFKAFQIASYESRSAMTPSFFLRPVLMLLISDSFEGETPKSTEIGLDDACIL